MTQKKLLITSFGFLSIAIILLNLDAPASAQEIKVKHLRKFTKRPKIGLVLSGGGAKGLAHVGILKVIEQSGLEIDCITGTSMGSIVGGLYAAGYNAAMLQDIVLTGDWDDLLADEVSRRSVAIDEKDGHDKYIGSLEIKKSGIQLPSGYKKGQKLTTLLSRLTMHVQHIKDFDRLPIPFRCIATDIVTGEACVLKEGFLADSLRASMSIPSIFTPVEIDGRLLVDGGVVRNLPVSDAREMGADVVIAVDVGAPLFKKEELTSIINIMDQSVSFLGAMSTQEQQLKSDILVIPDIKGFGSSEFSRGAELIKVGEDAGRLMLPELRALAEVQKKYPSDKIESILLRFIKKLKINPIDIIKKIRITSIEIRGLKNVSQNLVMGKLNISLHQEITPDDLTAAIDRVYASGFFERVTYQIRPAENRFQSNDTELILSVTETSGIFLKLGFSYDSDMNAAVLGNITIRNLAGQGSKFSIDARLSEFPGFLGSYFIHTGIRRPGIGFGVKIHYDLFNISTYKLGDIQSVYGYHNTGLDLLVQTILFNYVAFGLGVQKDLTFIRTQIAPSDPQNDDTEALNYYAYIMFDNLDNTLYPTSGVQIYGEAKYLTSHLLMLKDTNTFPNFFKYTVKLKAYIPLYPKRLTLYVGVTGGFIFAHEPYYLDRKQLLLTGPVIYRNSIPFIYENYMGGLMAYSKNCFPFTGLNFMQINGKQMLLGDVGLQVEFWKDLYIILRGSVGRTKNKFEDLFREKNLVIGQVYGTIVPIYHHLKNNLMYGYGFTLSYNSLIGPIEATLMRGSESNKYMFHFNIGYRI